MSAPVTRADCNTCSTIEIYSRLQSFLSKGVPFSYYSKIEKKKILLSLQEEEEDVPPPAPISPLPTVYVSGPPLETNNNNNKRFVP